MFFEINTSLNSTLEPFTVPLYSIPLSTMAIDFSAKEFQENAAYQQAVKLQVTYQKLVDQLVPHKGYRWAGFGCLFAFFLLRIVFTQGWYIICYALGIYLLNLFLAFLSPKFDPSLEQESRSENLEEGVPDEADIASEDAEEFRPFIRKLPEFKFWHNATRATLLSVFLSFWSIFDIPVFWPILLVYFITLFALTMRKQIQHMVKYRYLPFDIGKMKYTHTHSH